MNETGSPCALAGCDLTPLDSPACERYVSWLLGEENAVAPGSATRLAWALAHSGDGVTWGRYDAQKGVWLLGNQAASDVSPPVRAETLQELRLFGDGGEVLIWRTGAGLRGRMLRDTDPAAGCGDEANPLRPSEEWRILRGDRIIKDAGHDFTHIGDGAGAEQVLPLAVSSNEQLRARQVQLAVRHYYESDVHTGAVRIAATRLVTLRSGGGHGA
ncbi:MAG: hypothetical protein GMKNLPBB_01310 [Myxococcota bacterium]|nr:hypothetical protein [Myxococcota bacterium]